MNDWSQGSHEGRVGAYCLKYPDHLSSRIQQVFDAAHQFFPFTICAKQIHKRGSEKSFLKLLAQMVNGKKWWTASRTFFAHDRPPFGSL
jgi:hypothetical protein